MSSNSSEIMTNKFSICTFNILVPCYKRLSSEYDRESDYESIWKSRHLSIINLLQSLQIHLICLQEFWLNDRSFIDLYESHLSSQYSFHYVRRTHDLDDGLAIFVDQNYFKVIDKVDLLLNDTGKRVGLLLNLEYNGKCLLVINIHLTSPHNPFDRSLRLTQMKKFLQLIEEYQLEKNLKNKCSIILCGDFNAACDNDSVYQLLEKQFHSSYFQIHGKEPKVTYLTERNEELGVDFIFYQSNILRPVSSELIPRGCDSHKWHDSTEWNLGDHRAILTTFQYGDHQRKKNCTIFSFIIIIIILF
jgi:mRNA deadenylase 3'-5' endonuclease subunit Ccr4